MDLTKRPCRAPDFQVELLDDDIILFHPAGETIFSGNKTGALIWELCDGQRTLADISQLLSAAYPDAADRIERDVYQTVSTFIRHGAMTWC